jgi:serine/threonine protein kinase/tetratricopeptide (TPR) repeat protein
MASKPDPSGDETVAMTPFHGVSAGTTTGERVVLAGRYEILGLLGAGGMGSVYRAYDRELEETVALKTLREGTAATPRVLERFKREVRLARRVTHPNVARMFDIGEHESDRFITMEYVEGEPLAALIAREGRLLPARAADIATAICAGLEAAHAVGVVHRDLKPENILIERSGRVVITDFGIACAREDPADRAKTVGGVVGTPAYMAPEQVEALPDLDARADIYALGVMLFEMLTGLMPWRGDSVYTLATARLSNPPPSPLELCPDLPEAFARVVLRCMARERGDRYQSAANVAVDLGTHSPTLMDMQAPIHSSRPGPPREPAAPTKAGEKTLAVLPFRNAGAPEDQYVADGLTEDLIDTLSMAADLKVRPRASVLSIANESADPRELGRRLGVQVVVDGSVRRLGETLRISARLISVADGFQLWAKRFDRSPAEVLVVSDEAAQAITEALTVDTQAAPRAAPTDATAIDLYLQGRSELAKVWRTPTKRAVELFAEAERRAPADATLLAAHARARARLWYYDGGIAEGREARALAERALAKAPERGESWLALAAVRLVEQDLEAAARLLEQSLARAPHLAEAHELLAEVMLDVADVSRAISRFRTALALDPGLRCVPLLARALAYEERWDEVDGLLAAPGTDVHARVAIAAARARLALWTDDAPRRVEGVELPTAGEDELPLRYVQSCVDTIRTGKLSDSARAVISGALGRAEQAPRFTVFSQQLACELHAFAGELDVAASHLEAAVDAGLADRNWLERCPLVQRLAGAADLSALRGKVEARAERAALAVGSA